jgi:hypothetical protein
MIEAGLVLGLGEAILDCPAGAGDSGQLGQGSAGRRVAQEVGQLQLAFLAGVPGSGGPAGAAPC